MASTRTVRREHKKPGPLGRDSIGDVGCNKSGDPRMAYFEFTALTKITYLTIVVFTSVFLMYLITVLGGRVEGYLFPVAVAEKGSVSLISENINRTTISGNMIKNRSCEFKGMEAFLTNPKGDRIIVPIQVNETIKLRPTGAHPWGPWDLQIPLWQAEVALEIIVYHSCNPLYITETLFWKSSLDFTSKNDDPERTGVRDL